MCQLGLVGLVFKCSAPISRVGKPVDVPRPRSMSSYGQNIHGHAKAGPVALKSVRDSLVRGADRWNSDHGEANGRTDAGSVDDIQVTLFQTVEGELDLFSGCIVWNLDV